MTDIVLINFIDLSMDEKKMVLSWRNNEKIRKWMYDKESIALEDHIAYINSLKQRTDRKYFLVKQDINYLGVIDFTEIKEDQTHFGLYANPGLKGMGTKLMECIITYAFDTLKVKRVIAELFLENQKAYQLYSKFHFTKIEQKIINNQKVQCMELTYENR